MPSTPSRRLTFRRSQRLTKDREYRDVYDARVRKAAGPLTIFGLPRESGRPRLGLSVPAKVGTAVLRNRIKRLLRESFRLSQHGLPAYDYVVNVRPHTPLELERYRKLLIDAAAQIDREWRRRRREAQSQEPGKEESA
jgi:ribonuclease P protein component